MMKRLLVLLLPLLLAACSGAASETPAVEAALIEETASLAEPTEPEPTAAAPTAAAGVLDKSGSAMECTFVGDSPNVPPEFEAIFGVKENDWVQGSETAAVTIVEYSDFQ
jgi:protein-disulfide isomerase